MQNKIFSLEYTAKGDLKGIKVDHKNLIELLYSFGFRRWDLGKDFTFAKIQDHVIEEVTVTDIQDTLINHIKNLPEKLDDGVSREELLQKFYTSPGIYFNEKKLSLLQPDEPLTINRDTSDTAYIYYKNGFVECTKDGYSFCNYSKLKHFIGKNQIINRQFEINEQKNRSINELGIFARFCFNISFQENKRFESLQTIIGYCCHSFYETKLKAVNFTDSTISEQNEGRTGKSLFGKAIGKIKNCCDIPGKDFDPTKSFKFQMVQLDSQIVHLNDVRHGFDFESLYNVITDGLVVERKNMQPFPVSVKFIISSNKALNINGASSRDRIVEFEFSDHYSDKYSPADEFGLWLFTDFDQKEWNEFDNFMMNCITAYLAKGLIEPKAKNLNKRKLIQNTSHEFVEFMNEKFQSQELVSDNEYEKHDLHRKFLEEYSEFKEDRRLKKLTWFTKFCKQYAQFTEGIVGVKEGKSGNDRFITFLSDKSE